MSDLQQIPLSTITGDDASLADHAGSVLLIVFSLAGAAAGGLDSAGEPAAG